MIQSSIKDNLEILTVWYLIKDKVNMDIHMMCQDCHLYIFHQLV